MPNFEVICTFLIRVPYISHNDTLAGRNTIRRNVRFNHKYIELNSKIIYSK